MSNAETILEFLKGSPQGVCDDCISRETRVEPRQQEDAEIKRLMDALKLKAQLVRHNDAYYEKDGDGRPVGAPYCSACLETRHQAVHIHQNPAERRQSICPACKSVFHWQRRDPVASQDA